MITALNARPINKVAERVAGSGVENVLSDSLQPHCTWKSPRIMVTLTNQQIKNPLFIDLTGVVSGRLTVVGFLGAARWQVKCTCGNYSQRKSKAIKNNVMTDCCQECQRLIFLKRDDYRRRTGKDIDAIYFF